MANKIRTSVYNVDLSLPVSAAEAFAWHERVGALDRLLPPWERVVVESSTGGIRPGARVVLRMMPVPGIGVGLRWVAEHRGYEPGRMFEDVQVRGPFAEWVHEHRFADEAAGGSRMTDRVGYRLPGGAAGRLLGAGAVRGKLDAMFGYRHRVTAADIARHVRWRDLGPRRVLVSGASGTIGRQVCAMLSTGGHVVGRLVRRGSGGAGFPPAGTGPEIAWDPAREWVDEAALEAFTPHAVVHLAGENVMGGWWTAARKARVMDSRVNGTRAIAGAMARLRAKRSDGAAGVLVSASAIGWYGQRGDDLCGEEAPAGEGFLAEVCRRWEEATAEAERAGVRVVRARIGLVLTPRAGVLASVGPLHALGLGGRLGSGRQWWSWIGIDDCVYALHECVMNAGLAGAVNVVGPGAVRQEEFSAVLASVMRRWRAGGVLADAGLRLAGELGREVREGGSRVQPRALQEAGFEWTYPTLEGTVRHVLGRHVFGRAE